MVIRLAQGKTQIIGGSVSRSRCEGRELQEFYGLVLRERINKRTGPTRRTKASGPRAKPLHRKALQEVRWRNLPPAGSADGPLAG